VTKVKNEPEGPTFSNERCDEQVKKFCKHELMRAGFDSLTSPGSRSVTNFDHAGCKSLPPLKQAWRRDRMETSHKSVEINGGN
jgi:hypothetical protein